MRTDKEALKFASELLFGCSAVGVMLAFAGYFLKGISPAVIVLVVGIFFAIGLAMAIVVLKTPRRGDLAARDKVAAEEPDKPEHPTPRD